LRWRTADHTANDRRYLTTLGISAYTHSGVIGYPHEPALRRAVRLSNISAKQRAT
jgi:hypothetical protein